MATTEEYAQQNEYAHSLFVADYAVTHAVSWDDLNATADFWQRLRHRQRGLYAACAVRGKWWYRLGCFRTRHAPKQRMGQDTGQGRRIYQKLERYRFLGTRYLPNTLSNRVIRGRYDLPRKYAGANTTLSFKFLGFRPVLEVLNPDTLDPDGLKAVYP